MIYPPISLYPNGAFMICEDVSEFDPNMHEPHETIPQLAQRVEEEIDKYADEQEDIFPSAAREAEPAVMYTEPPKPVIIRNPALEKEPGPTLPPKVLEYRIGDPVERVIEKLTPVYRDFVEPLLNLNYEFERPAVAIDNMEWITKNTRAMIDILRTTLVQLKALYCVSEEPFTSTYFYSNLGTFLRNSEHLYQQGLGKFNYKYNVINAFSNMFNMRDIFRAISCNPQILTTLLTGTDIVKLYPAGAVDEDDGRFDKYFANVVDMIKCVFTEQDRLMRFCEEDNRTLDLNHLLKDASRPEEDPHDSSTISYQKRLMKDTTITLLKLFAGSLKCVSSKCYEVMCRSTDIELTGKMYEMMVQPMMCEVVNIFALGTMACLTFATELKGLLEKVNGIEQYTEQLIKKLEEVH